MVLEIVLNIIVTITFAIHTVLMSSELGAWISVQV